MSDNNGTVVYMLTTIDNPFDPFTQYDDWFAFDVSHGYNTCSYLARIARTSDELSDHDEEIALQVAMDDIVSFNITGNYIKVTKDSFKSKRA